MLLNFKSTPFYLRCRFPRHILYTRLYNDSANRNPSIPGWREGVGEEIVGITFSGQCDTPVTLIAHEAIGEVDSLLHWIVYPSIPWSPSEATFDSGISSASVQGMLVVKSLFVLLFDELLQVVSRVQILSPELFVAVHCSSNDCPFLSHVSVAIVDGQRFVIKHVRLAPDTQPAVVYATEEINKGRSRTWIQIKHILVHNTKTTPSSIDRNRIMMHEE